MAPTLGLVLSCVVLVVTASTPPELPSTVFTTNGTSAVTPIEATAKAPTVEPIIPKALDPASLHRVPLYKAVHPAIETISKLETQFGSEESATRVPDISSDASHEVPLVPKRTADLNRLLKASHSTTKTPAVEAAGTSTEAGPEPFDATKGVIPHPANCPDITGTSTRKNNDLHAVLRLGGSSPSRDAQRGCRFFIMNELMDRSKEEYTRATIDEQVERTYKQCFNSCQLAYGNETEGFDFCIEGCKKASDVTKAAKVAARASPEDDAHEKEEETSSADGAPRLIPFHIISIDSEGASGSRSLEVGPSQEFQMPQGIRMMLGLMHQMAERARASMASAQTGPEVEVSPMGKPFPDSGNSFTMSRSMSVIVTKDKDGHSKVVVMRSPPRMSIHRAGDGNGLEFDESSSLQRHMQALVKDLVSQGKDPQSGPSDSTVDSSSSASSGPFTGSLQFPPPDFFFDDTPTLGASDDSSGDEEVRMRFVGHLTNGHEFSHPEYVKLNLKEDEYDSAFESFRKSRFCENLVPRLLSFSLIVLVLGLLGLICITCRQKLDAAQGRALAATGAGGAPLGKRRQFFSKTAASYVQLNGGGGKRGSTSSTAPFLSGYAYFPSSWLESAQPQVQEQQQGAEALPEKAPLPQGGLEVKAAEEK